MNKTSTAICGLLLLLSLVVKANPADTTLKRLIQSDGRVLELYLRGDEWFNYAVTSDGYTILPNQNADYCYAYQNSAGEVVVSKYLATNPAMRTAEEQIFLSKVSKGLKPLPQYANHSKNLAERKSYPTTGTNNLLVILVEFPDRPFTYTATEFQNLFSQQGYSSGGASGSVKDYFRDCSNGLLDLNPTVAGPVMLSNNMAYYGAPGESFSDVRPKEMVSEACSLVDASIDFSQFDMDNDGRIDAVHIIFAGGPQSRTGEANAIWPHRWFITEEDGLPRTFDGKTLCDYSCSGEKRGVIMDGIGTVCHEFGHVLGLPDFYDTDYEATGGNAIALSSWSIMSSGSYNNNGDTPAAFNANERSRLGWLSLDTLTLAGTYSLPAITDSNRAYIITTPYEDEYFILENRRQASWDAYIPASGMLIYHIKNTGDYCINCDPAFQRCDIEEADANETLASVRSDVFPHPFYNDFFTDYAEPNSRLWSGEQLNKPITNITRDTISSIVSFDFLQPDSSAFIKTLNSAEFLSTISVRLTAYEYYEGLYDYSLRGFAIDTQSNFATQTFVAATSVSNDTLICELSNLNYLTTYYYRAAYVGETDTVYGTSYYFSTRDGQPILKTEHASNITLNSMTLGGKKLVEGDYPVIEYGICYDTLPSPTIDDNHISFQGDFTTFSTEISGLQQATKYYFATYCKTILGTKYATQAYATTLYVPIENNEIAAEMSGCEGDVFGTIIGSQPCAGQGNFTYLWQQKTQGSSWQEAQNDNTFKDYVVGELNEPTSFRRIVFSYAIKDTSNVINVEVKQSQGGKIKTKTDWLSSETDTLSLIKNVGTPLSWQHSADSLSWSSINAPADSSIAYTPGFSDSVYLRVAVQLEQCPIAHSEVAKIYVQHDVSLEDIKPEELYVVYPNPASDFVKIANQQGKTLCCSLYDAQSKKVFEDCFSLSTYLLDISCYPSGVYLMKIEDRQSKETYVIKLVVSRY